MIKSLIIALSLLVTAPAFAQECTPVPTAAELAQVQAQNPELRFEFLEGASLKTFLATWAAVTEGELVSGIDYVIVVTLGDNVRLIGFNDGCYLGYADMPLSFYEMVKARTQASNG